MLAEEPHVRTETYRARAVIALSALDTVTGQVTYTTAAVANGKSIHI